MAAFAPPSPDALLDDQEAANSSSPRPGDLEIASPFRPPPPEPLAPESFLPQAAPAIADARTSAPALTFVTRTSGYHPSAPGSRSYAMEGGGMGAERWHGEDVEQEPLHTLDAFRRGEAPYVSVAMDNNKASNPLPYGAVLRSPDFPGVPFRVMDTGIAFNGQAKDPALARKYGAPKGLSRMDIARDSAAGANSDENNRHVTFEVGAPTSPPANPPVAASAVPSGPDALATAHTAPFTPPRPESILSEGAPAAFTPPAPDTALPGWQQWARDAGLIQFHQPTPAEMPQVDVAARATRAVGNLAGNVLHGLGQTLDPDFRETDDEGKPMSISMGSDYLEQVIGGGLSDAGKLLKGLSMMIKTDPANDQAVLSKAIDSGVPAAGMIAASFADPLLGAAVFASSTGEDLADRAQKAGKSPEVVQEARATGQLIGAATAAVPVAKIRALLGGMRLNPFVRDLGEGVTVELTKPDRVKSMLNLGIEGLKMAGINSAAMTAQQLAVNLADQKLIDPSQAAGEGLPEAAGAGALIGFLGGAIAAAKGTRVEATPLEARTVEPVERAGLPERFTPPPPESEVMPGEPPERPAPRAGGPPAGPETPGGTVTPPAEAPATGAQAQFEQILSANARKEARWKLYDKLGFPLPAIDAMTDPEMQAAVAAGKPYVAPAPAPEEPAQPSGLSTINPQLSTQRAARSDADLLAEQRARAEMESEMRGQMETSGGRELAGATSEYGLHLPATGSPHYEDYKGELDHLRETFDAAKQTGLTKLKLNDVFRKDAPSPDDAATRARQFGFDFQSPYDLIAAWEHKLGTGRDVWGFRNLDEPLRVAEEPAPRPRETKIRERIVAAATKAKGKIVEGRTHMESTLAAQDAGLVGPNDAPDDSEDLSAGTPTYTEGFVTNAGRFLNRAEALEFAKKTGQLNKSYKAESGFGIEDLKNATEILDEPLHVAEGAAREPSRAMQPQFATRNHTPVVQAKSALRAEDYPPAKVVDLVNNLYHPAAYSALSGKPNVYLVMPSTSAKNTIPLELARRLQRDFGGEILNDFARPMAAGEAKLKVHWLDKAADPVRFEFHSDPRTALKGKHVVLVDDILTTGESIRALTESLNALGIRNITPAVLAAKKGGHPAGPPDYRGLATKLAKATGADAGEIEQQIRLAYPHAYADFLTRAVQDANDHPSEVAAAIRRTAEAVRAARFRYGEPPAGPAAPSGTAQPGDIPPVPGLAAGGIPPAQPGAGGAPPDDEQLKLLETVRRNGVPRDKLRQAADGISRTLSLRADPQLALPFQEPQPAPVLRGGRGKGLAAGAHPGPGEREAGALEAERRRNLAITRLHEPAAVAEAFAGGDTISSILPQLASGEIPAFDIVGKRIESPADFAMLAQTCRTPYFESLKAAALDSKGRVVSSQVIAVGSLNESMVPIEALTRFALAAKGRGAGRIIVSHNHPSGDPSPSQADINVTKRVEQAMKAVGVDLIDHVITNGPRFYSFKGNGLDTIKASPARWEIVPREQLSLKLQERGDLGAIAAALRQGDPGHSHVVYINTRFAVTAVERLPAGISQEAFVARIHEGVAREGAFAVALDLPHEAQPEKVQNLIEEIKGPGRYIRVLDATNAAVPSFKEANLMEQGTFYERPGPLREQASALASLREEPADYSPLRAVDAGGTPFANVPLAHAEEIKIVQMPEMVQLANDLGAKIELKKFPKAMGKFYGIGTGMIKLDPRIFADPTTAAKVLMHEIGHLVDWGFPEKTLARGNLHGRLWSLKRFMDEHFARSIATNKYLRAELLGVTRYWHPYDPEKVPASYRKYRESSKELYADALSVMFNSPDTLKQMAPQFWKDFFAGLDKKQEAKDAFFNLQQWLNRPLMERLESRSRETQRWFGDGEEIFQRKMAERELRYRGYRGFLDRMKQAFYDQYSPIRDRAKGTPMETTVNFFFDAHPLAENLNYRLLERLHRQVVQPLEAAGHSLDELGEHLFLSRIANERYDINRKIAGEQQIETGGRSVIPNPGGHTPDTARAGLLRMRLAKGMDGMAQIEAASQRFHDEVFRIMREAHKAGLLTGDQMKLIAGNRNNYATFTPLEYVDTFVPSGILHQAGTFKEIANPYLSTVLKMVTMTRAIELQRAKQLAVGVLQNHFPGEIARAETRRDASGRESPVPPKVRGMQQIMLREAGKPAWHNVPAEIHEMFERGDVPLLRSAMEVLGWPFRNVFYPLYITFNPLFQLIRHPIREARRSFRNQPNELRTLSLYDTIGQRVRPELRAFVARGEISPLIAEMLAQRVITPPELDFISSFKRKDAFGEMLRNFNLLPEENKPAWTQARILQPAVKLSHWIERAGHINMLLPRVGVYKALVKDLGWGRADAAFYVRNHIGVPNHLKKGRWSWIAGDVFPFINVWTKGWGADMKLASRGYQRSDRPDAPGKSAASWWFRWAATSGIWTLLKAAASLGLLGAGLKALMERVSTHDKLNYDVLPIGTLPGGDFGGKTAFLAIPQDQTDRMLSGLAFQFLTSTGKAAMGQPVRPGAAAAEAFRIGTSDMPGVNPLVTIAAAWKTYIQGQNPIDNFRSSPILTNDEFLAGGWPATQHMLGWTSSQVGAQTFIHYNDRTSTLSETVLGSIPVVNGVIKISDYGLREQQAENKTVEEAAKAGLRLSLPKNVQELSNEYNFLKGIGNKGMTDAQQARYLELSAWHAAIYAPAMQAITEETEANHGGSAAGMKSALGTDSEGFRRK